MKQGGREADLIVVGMGADETETLVNEPAFVASVGYFPERYGNFLVPMALAELAGIDLPPTVLQTHVMVNKGNVCEYYPDFKCSDDKGIELKFSAGEVRRAPRGDPAAAGDAGLRRSDPDRVV